MLQALGLHCKNRLLDLGLGNLLYSVPLSDCIHNKPFLPPTGQSATAGLKERERLSREALSPLDSDAWFKEIFAKISKVGDQICGVGYYKQ